MKSFDDLVFIQKNVFDICGFSYTPTVIETESADYSACQFRLDDRSVLYRLAKTTPTKNGQFVTLWKRKPKGPIQPYDVSDKIDIVIINVIKNNQRGIFVFPADALVKQGIFSVKNKGGKRAMRVYPPWDKPESKQAEKTQKWQMEYFVDVSKYKSTDVNKWKSFFEK